MHMNGLCTCLVSRLVFCCVPEIIEISNIHNDGIKENVGAAKRKNLRCTALLFVVGLTLALVHCVSR